MVALAVIDETPPLLLADQEANPFASDTKTFPAPGVPPSISMVPVNTVLPPTFNAPAIPAPPATFRAPDVEEVEAVAFVIVVIPPMFAAPAIPTPPATVKAPVVVEVDAVELGKFKAPMILASVVVDEPINVVFEPNPTVPAEPSNPEITISFLSPFANGRTSYPIKTLFRPVVLAVEPVEILLPANEPMNTFWYR